MLKLPPPVWALVYVLFAVAISWPLGWPKMPGFPLPPLGIALVTVPWILPVWAIIMFRREGTEVSPTSPANSQAYHHRSIPFYTQPHVPRTGYSHPRHRSMGRRLANVPRAHRRLRHCKLGPHPV
jgi:hypothetical protein